MSTRALRLVSSITRASILLETKWYFARGPQLEKMLYEISNLSLLARFQDFILKNVMLSIRKHPKMFGNLPSIVKISDFKMKCDFRFHQDFKEAVRDFMRVADPSLLLLLYCFTDQVAS